MQDSTRKIRHAFAFAAAARRAAANRRRIRNAARAAYEAWAHRKFKAGDVAVQSAADPPLHKTP